MSYITKKIPYSFRQRYYLSQCSGITSEYYRTLTRYEENRSTPDPESRPYPSDPLKSLTSWGPAWTQKSWAADSGEYLRALYHDYSCTPSVPNGRKYMYRSFQKVNRLQTSSLDLDWPDWATKLRLQIKDRKLNLGATLAEYRQSVSMFGSAARGIADAVRSIRGLKRFKKRSLCSITNAHLIHDYGVAPLMSDMFETVEKLRLRLGVPVYERFHFRQSPAPTSDVARGYAQGGSVELVREARRRGSQEITAYVEMDLDALAEDITFGNPAEILWEVTPFSFVIDWMLPIGDALISLDALKGVKSTRTCLVRKEWQKDKVYWTGQSQAGTFVSGSPGKVTYERHERIIPATAVPLPSLPEFDPSKSISTLLNAVSLLVSVRGCKGVNPRYSRSDFGLPR